MNVTREDMPGRQVALTIELEPETVNSALDRAYRQMVNQVNVPGFRRGKAPRYILESYVGKEMLTERAVKNILPQTVQDAIAEQNIEAMDVGDVEIVSMDPLQVKVIIVQPPSVQLGDYSGVRVEKESVEITDEQVEEVLAELRREGVPWEEPAEPRPVKEGDMVYLDLEAFTTAGPLEEAQRENFPTIIGLRRAGVPETVNQALIGMSVGEEKDLADTLPDDYPNEELRGKDVTYHITVRQVKEQAIPELTDEFAKNLGDYENVEALREAVQKNLQQRTEKAAEDNQVHNAIAHLVNDSTVEVPEKMVDEELDLMLKRLEDRLKEQRINLRQYFMYNGSTEDEWRQANRERARERLVRGLVLQEFARREGIEVDESEIEGEIENMLGRFDEEEKDKARTVLGGEDMRHGLEDQIYQRKILDRLIGIAEGRIVAAPMPAADEAPTQSAEDEDEDKEDDSDQVQDGDDDAGTTTDLEEAGGAAELLGTEGVDTRSPYETGEASGGGTPSDAPRLDTESESNK